MIKDVYPVSGLASFLLKDIKSTQYLQIIVERQSQVHIGRSPKIRCTIDVLPVGHEFTVRGLGAKGEMICRRAVIAALAYEFEVPAAAK